MLQCCYIQLIMSLWPGHEAHIEPISPSSFYTAQARLGIEDLILFSLLH